MTVHLKKPAAGAIPIRAVDRAGYDTQLAGAPASPLAGLTLDVHLGDTVDAGQALFTLHAQSPGELAYAMEYVARHPGIVGVEAFS